MHLTHFSNGTSRPAHWHVVDDFGTQHDALLDNAFGGNRGNAHAQRWSFFYSNFADPDFIRIDHTSPEQYHARHPIQLAGPFGTTIEAEIEVDFQRIPAWDDSHTEALHTKLEGARIEINSACVRTGWKQHDIPQGGSDELERFCWDFIALKEAEAARRRRT